MEQQFSSLFTALRKNLASEELFNVRTEQFHEQSPGSVDTPADAAELLSNVRTPFDQLAENEFIMHANSSFLDQRRLLNAQYATLERQMDERLKHLEQLKFSRLQVLEEQRTNALHLVSHVQTYAEMVNDARQKKDKALLFQAQCKIQQLLEQCRGEISKETQRLRDHNRAQFETLSCASAAMQQRIICQRVLTLLLDQARHEVQVNNIGIVAHARDSHFPRSKQRRLIAASLHSPSKDASPSDDETVVPELDTATASDDILLLWNPDLKFRGSQALSKELLELFLQNELNALPDRGVAHEPDISSSPQFYAVTQISKTVMRSRSNKKPASASTPASAAPSRRRRGSATMDDSSATNSIQDLTWKTARDPSSLLSQLSESLHLSPSQQSPKNSPTKATPKDQRLFPATTPVSASCIRWMLMPEELIGGFVYYKVEDFAKAPHRVRSTRLSDCYRQFDS